MKYHRTNSGSLARCREVNGNCPYGGPVNSFYSTSLNKEVTTRAEEAQELRQQARETSLKTVLAKHLELRRVEKEVAARILSPQEYKIHTASEVLYDYDSTKGRDERVNNQLMYLRLTHPNDFIRLSEGFEDYATARERKQAIKKCYDFYVNNPTGLYQDFPRRGHTALTDEAASFFTIADESGDPTLQARLEYLWRKHPEVCKEAHELRHRHASEKDYEQFLNDSYHLWVKFDAEDAKEVYEMSKTTSFQRAANALASFYRRSAKVKTWFEEVAANGAGQNRSQPREGEVVNNKWTYSKGKLYYRVDTTKEEATNKIIELLASIRNTEANTAAVKKGRTRLDEYKILWQAMKEEFRGIITEEDKSDEPHTVNN